MDENRYGQAYARTLQALADRGKLIQPQLDLKPGELLNDTHPLYKSRLDEMQERLVKFLTAAHASPLYDLENRGEKELAALDDAVILYAMGGVDDRGVEACARIYLRACRRPQAIERGERNPPPAPGTYGGKVQPGYSKQMSRPAPTPVSLEIERIDREGAVLQELSPDFWRYAVLLEDYEGTKGVGYFKEKPLKAGSYGYAKYSPHSLQAYPEKPQLWAVQFYSPETGTSYYLRAHQIEAHAPADNQAALDRAWSKGFVSNK